MQGFGYVEFADNNALQQAVDMEQPELHGRKMTIMVSKPPSTGAGRGAGRDGGFRGGSRGRGGPARGFGAGKGDRGRSIHQHERLAIAQAPAFVPRVVAKKEIKTIPPTSTNDDFRKLLNKQ